MKELIEVLEIEHMRHRGCANGHLFKSYRQFVEAGFNRNTISTMTKLAEALGFIKITRETGTGNNEIRDACAYTLTYLPSGVGRDIAPTDDWKRIKTPEQAAKIVSNVTKKGTALSKARDRRTA